jgi:hypothetical protein
LYIKISATYFSHDIQILVKTKNPFYENKCT